MVSAFSVDLKPAPSFCRCGDTEICARPRLIAVNNQGGPAEGQEYPIFAVSLQGMTSLKTNRHGDLPGRDSTENEPIDLHDRPRGNRAYRLRDFRFHAARH